MSPRKRSLSPRKKSISPKRRSQSPLVAFRDERRRGIDILPGDNLDKSRPRLDMSRPIDTFDKGVKYRPEDAAYNEDLRTDKQPRNNRLLPSPVRAGREESRSR